MTIGWVIFACAGVFICLERYGAWLKKHPDKDPSLRQYVPPGATVEHHEADAEGMTALMEAVFTAGMRSAHGNVSHLTSDETDDDVEDDDPDTVEIPVEEIQAEMELAEQVRDLRESGVQLPAAMVLSNPELARLWLEGRNV